MFTALLLDVPMTRFPNNFNDKNYIAWFIESIVGVVGDSMLGADFPIYIYAYE